MKRTISIAFAAFALLSFTSCQKENLVSGNQEPSQRIVTAVFENSDTKTTLGTNDIPLWAEGDKICILASNDSVVIKLQESNITENGRKVTFTLTKELSGTLYAVYPASATTMTSCTDGNINFTIPELQDGTFGSANICVAKGDSKDNLVFSNATAVLEINTAADVVGVEVTAANNIAGSVTASFAGTTLNLTTSSLDKTSVSAVCKSAPSGNVFYLAAAPVSTGSTTATCYTIDKKGSAVKDSKELHRNVIYSMNLSSMTINTDCDLTGTKGTLNGHECVIIKAKYDGTNDSYLKWATRNIGATADTGTGSYGTYFAWGETTGHSLKSDISISNFVGNAFNNGHSFSNAPTLDPEDPEVLPLSYDAAYRNWGTGWRMPTGYISSSVPGEFKALKDATYWKWDGTDKGYYVYAPQSGDAGKKNSESGVKGTYNKSDALLFLPAAGNGSGNALQSADSDGTYWSSSLRSDNNYAYYLYFDKNNVNPESYRSRWNGLPVRPVSD